jgi:fatty acid desaturase
MHFRADRPHFNDPALDAKIRELRAVDNITNLIHLATEYLGITATITVAVTFSEYRTSWGLAWAWNVPVFTLAIALIGGFQHRLAGLGHEASHYTLLRNKKANDLVADLFCMFPILTNLHFYRLFHMAHHQYTNDWDRDPDLVNMGRSKGVSDYPMERWRVPLRLHLRALTVPIAFLRYQWDYIYVNVLGKGGNIYMSRVEGGDGGSRGLRLGTVLGLLYAFGFNALGWWLTSSGRASWLVPAGMAGIALVAVVAWRLPEKAIFRSPFRQAYGPRVGGVLRLAYLTIAMVVLASLRHATDGKSAMYVMLLWFVPMTTTFMIYMLLRDVYQHANADDGRLTNSRIFFTDPFTRWAVFVYGQDVHVTHHLFPAIPHYHLPRLHRLLQAEHAEYAEKVVECHGTFTNGRGERTILDVLSRPRPMSRPLGQLDRRHAGVGRVVDAVGDSHADIARPGK